MRVILTFFRRLLLLVVLLVSAFALALFYKPKEIRNEAFAIQLGTEYRVSTGLYNVPDTNSSIVTRDGTKYLYFSADVAGYRAKVTSTDPFRIDIPEKLSIPSGATRADGSYQGYNAVGSAITRADGVVCVFNHVEYWGAKTKSFPFSAEIEITCGDSQERTTILTGASRTILVSDRVTGVGQPCAIIREDFVYLYHTDWDSGLDTVHVARAPVEKMTDPASWLKYLDGGFTSPGISGASSPVVMPPETTDRYTAMCSISWNSYLEKFLMSFETATMVYLTTSIDGLVWKTTLPVMRIDQPSVKLGYFSVVRVDTPNGVTSKDALLVFTKRTKNTKDTMYAVPIHFS